MPTTTLCSLSLSLASSGRRLKITPAPVINPNLGAPTFLMCQLVWFSQKKGRGKVEEGGVWVGTRGTTTARSWNLQMKINQVLFHFRARSDPK